MSENAWPSTYSRSSSGVYTLAVATGGAIWATIGQAIRSVRGRRTIALEVII